AAAGARHGDGREHDEERGRVARTEPERGPDERRQTEICQRIVRQGGHQVAEDDERGEDARAREQQSLDRPVAPGRRPGVTRAAPTSASSVLPAAIPSDDRTEPAVVTLTRKAPTKITGQMPRPSSSMAASAMPVGGQTGVALACTMAKARPSLPATTYTTPTPSVTPSRAARSCIPLPSLRSGAALHRVGLPAGEAALVEHRRVHAAHRPSPAQHERDLLAHAAQPHGIEARGGGGDVRRQDDV